LEAADQGHDADDGEAEDHGDDEDGDVAGPFAIGSAACGDEGAGGVDGGHVGEVDACGHAAERCEEADDEIGPGSEGHEEKTEAAIDFKIAAQSKPPLPGGGADECRGAGDGEGDAPAGLGEAIAPDDGGGDAPENGGPAHGGHVKKMSDDGDGERGETIEVFEIESESDGCGDGGNGPLTYTAFLHPAGDGVNHHAGDEEEGDVPEVEGSAVDQHVPGEMGDVDVLAVGADEADGEEGDGAPSKEGEVEAAEAVEEVGAVGALAAVGGDDEEDHCGHGVKGDGEAAEDAGGVEFVGFNSVEPDNAERGNNARSIQANQAI